MRTLIGLSLLALALPHSRLHAAPLDIASLFPADTLAYVELNQPGAVAKDLAAFFKGSSFENALPALDKIRGKSPPNGTLDTSAAGMLSALLGPEMLAEAPRFDGIAAALTGFSKSGEAEWVSIILTGDSQLPGFIIRAYLSAHPDIRKVTTISGFDLYQEQMPNYNVEVLVPPELEPTAIGPIVAFQPGIVLIGSSRTALSNAIQRWKGEDKTSALFKSERFKEHAAQRKEPGLFLFADANRLLECLPASKQRQDPFCSSVARKWLPTDTLKSCTARLKLGAQGVELHASLWLDPAKPSPLADFLSGPALSVEQTTVESTRSAIGCRINLPAPEQRVKSLLTLIDSMIKASGTLGPTASEMLRELEAMKVLSTAQMEKISSVTLLLPPSANWPKEGCPFPTFLVETESPESVEPFEDSLPALLQFYGKERATPITETINGIPVRSIEATGSPFGPTLHFAKQKNAFAVGGNRSFVASCLQTQQPSAAKSTSELHQLPGLAVLNWQGLILPARDKLKTVETRKPLSYRDLGGNGKRQEMSDFIFATELAQPFTSMPPLTARFGRMKNELQIEIKQSDPKQMRSQIINKWFETFTMSATMGLFPERGIFNLQCEGIRLGDR